MDVASAYLHTPLDPEEKLYLRPPKGFEIVARFMGLEYEEGDLMMLHSCIYGLKQAGREWFLRWITGLKALGFVQ